MAILSCPECESDVFDTSHHCSNCGFDIEQYMNAPMPDIPLDLNIGGAVKDAMLFLDVIDDSRQVYLFCHIRGLSMLSEKGGVFDVIAYSHLIKCRLAQKHYFVRDLFDNLEGHNMPYLQLEYWNWKTKRRACLNLALVDRESAFCEQDVIYKDFLAKLSDIRFRSDWVLENTSPEETAYAERNRQLKRKNRSSLLGCLLPIFCVIMFFVAGSSIQAESSFAIVFLIIFLASFVGVFMQVLGVVLTLLGNGLRRY